MNRDRLHLDQLQVGEAAALTLDVAAGEVVCLSGASGSGKTRLLRAVADLDPHQGDVWLGDCEQRRVEAHQWRQWVRFIPAESQWWHVSAAQHFNAPPQPQHLEALQLEAALLEVPVTQLSSGERQRLALLRGVSFPLRVLLLDEPTANLDQSSLRATENWLQQQIQAAQWPVLWVAHDPAQIARVAQRHFHLDAGRWQQQG